MTIQITASTPMVNLTIDGRPISVPKGTAVYAATKQLGIEVPVFCFHDRMPAFGACRVCLVEVEKMPKLQTSCTLEATEGMVVRTQSAQAVEGRKSILEFLLINHPLDCPICDRAGECPLQNQTLNHGPGESRFFEAKRRFKKAVPLGPVLMLDRERCISCARCTRFGEIVAGDHGLEFIDRGHKTEVGTANGGPPQSKFIGNTIMICPVGALTSQVYRFRSRPWDNQETQSTCTLCPVGCSLNFDARDGQITRTRSRENPAVNDVWLCDKGWFGYEFASHTDRLKHPLIRRNGKLEPATWNEAFDLIAEKINEYKAGGLIAGFGGSTLTFEENYLFQHLMRKGAGVNHVDYRVGKSVVALENEGLAPGMQTSIGECEELSHALLLGVDLTEEFPLIWLRLKHAIHYGAQLSFAGHYAPEGARYFTQTHLHAPLQELQTLKSILPSWLAQVQGAKKAAVFIGRQYLDSPYRQALGFELEKLRKQGIAINVMEGSGNSFGARYAGMHPQLAPFGERILNAGLDVQKVIEKACDSGWNFLYVAGAHLAGQLSRDQWKTLRSRLDFLVVQDLFLNETAQEADVVLPTLCHIEKEGSFVNIEGRLQALRPGKEIPADLLSDGEIFSELCRRFDIEIPSFAFIEKLRVQRISFTLSEQKSSSTPVSGTNSPDVLRATFAPTLFDQGERMKRNTHAAQLATSPHVRVHPTVGLAHKFDDGAKAQLIVNSKSILINIKLDPNVAQGSVVLPLGFEELALGEINTSWINGFEVEIQPLL